MRLRNAERNLSMRNKYIARLLCAALLLVFMMGGCSCAPAATESPELETPVWEETLSPSETASAGTTPDVTPTQETPEPAPSPSASEGEKQPTPEPPETLPPVSTPSYEPAPSLPPLEDPDLPEGVNDEMAQVMNSFCDAFFEAQKTMTVQDITNYFAEDAYENAVLNQTAMEVLLMMRQASINDLSLNSYNCTLEITSCERTGNTWAISALEDSQVVFAFYPDVTAETQNVEHTFVLTYENGQYKIVSHEKEEDFFKLVLSSYTPGQAETNGEIDAAFASLKESLSERIEQGFSQLYEDYDTYQEGLPAISITYDHAYNRENARNYALKYALTRNPSWTRYDAWGGNCQNYGSQCIFAGGVPMDYTGSAQWKHYGSTVNGSQTPTGRSTSWTGVSQFYTYASANSGSGMVAIVDYNYFGAEPGDIIQLGNNGSWAHTVVVTDVIRDANGNVIDLLISSNTIDRVNYPASAYGYSGRRVIKILGWND